MLDMCPSLVVSEISRQIVCSNVIQVSGNAERGIIFRPGGLLEGQFVLLAKPNEHDSYHRKNGYFEHVFDRNIR